MASKYFIPERRIIEIVDRLKTARAAREAKKQTEPRPGTCWLCYDPDNEENKFLRTQKAICKCKGSIADIHISCFDSLIKHKKETNKSLSCDTCKNYYSDESLQKLEKEAFPADKYTHIEMNAFDQGVNGKWYIYYQKDENGRPHGEYHCFHEREISNLRYCSGCVRRWYRLTCPGHSTIIKERRLVKRSNYYHGLLHGDYTLYNWNSGQPLVIRTYIEGLRDGEFKTYSDSGALLKSEFYHLGLKHGKTTDYTVISTDGFSPRPIVQNYSEGLLHGLCQEIAEILIGSELIPCIKETMYEMGEPVSRGVIKYYNRDSFDILKVVSYNEKGLDGTQEEYCVLEKKVVSTAEYKDGELIQKTVNTYEYGYLKESNTYGPDGIISGNCVKYYPDGSVESSSQYKNGKFHGVRMHRNDAFQISGEYQNGIPQGLFKVTVEDKLAELATYSEGILNGIFQIYQNGRLVQHATYKNGVLNGPLSFFDEEQTRQFDCLMENGYLKEGSIARYYDDTGKPCEKYKIQYKETLDEYIQCLNRKFISPGERHFVDHKYVLDNDYDDKSDYYYDSDDYERYYMSQSQKERQKHMKILKSNYLFLEVFNLEKRKILVERLDTMFHNRKAGKWYNPMLINWYRIHPSTSLVYSEKCPNQILAEMNRKGVHSWMQSNDLYNYYDHY